MIVSRRTFGFVRFGGTDNNPMAGKRPWPASAVGGEPASQNVEQDHDGAGHQQSGDESEADQQGIDPGPVGKTAGNAHDLALGPVEKKTTVVHLDILERVRVQAIGSALVAVLTKSIAVMKAAAKAVAVSRAELRTNMTFPFFMCGPLIGPRHDQCRERAKWKLSLFFSEGA
jgi:hypothetical protein